MSNKENKRSVKGYEIKKASDLKNPKLKDLFNGVQQTDEGRSVDTGVAANLQSYANYLQRGKKKDG